MAVDDRSDDAGEVPAYHPGGKVPQEDRRFTPGYAQQVAAGLHSLLGELGGGAPAQEPAQGALQDADAAGTRRAG